MTQDTRKDPRAKIVSLNVRYKSATVDEFIDNHSHDVSKGGIFIKTPSPFPPGTLLKFEIRIAGDKAVIAGVGRVVWKREAAQSNSEQPAGMGVKFIKIDDPSRAVIDRLVDSKGGAGSAYEEGGGDLSAGLPPAPEAATLAPAVVAKDARKIAPKPASIAASPPPAAQAKPPAASRAPSIGPMSSGKATMMGLGGVSRVPAGRAAGVPTPAAGRPAGEDARTHTPHGGMAAPRPVPLGPTARAVAAPASTDAPAMFPKTNSFGEMPPTGDQTVMKQAAELLEEALRGAGGSMDEIGQNPLFDQVSSKTKDAESAATLAKLKEPAAGNPHEIVQSPGPVDVDELMRPIPELERNVAAERARRSSFPPAATPRGAQKSLAQAESEIITSRKPKDGGAARPAAAAVGDRPPRSKWLVSVLLVGAAGGLGFFAYTQVHSSQTDDAIPPIPVPSASASAPPIPPPASASAPVASASVQPSGDVMLEGGTGDAALVTADASIVDSARPPVATATPVAAPAAPWRPPRKPAAAPTAAPASTDESAPAPPATAAGASSASQTPTATAPPTDTPGTPPTATPKPTSGKPATKPKSDDDNPY